MEENIMQRFARPEATTTNREREELRQKLAQDIETYLAGGGTIEVIEPFARADRPLDRNLSIIKSDKRELDFQKVAEKRNKLAFDLEAIAHEAWPQAQCFYAVGSGKGYNLRRNPYAENEHLGETYDKALETITEMVENAVSAG